jgi:hypothetical protein
MIHNFIIFATNIPLMGLSISISNDITGRKTTTGSGPSADFWVDDLNNNMVTDSGDKIIFSLT